MHRWGAQGALDQVEDVGLDGALVAACEAAALARGRPIRFSTPTFKDYASDELAGCGKNRFPAFSITGGACALGCDHCQAKILAPMIAATTPEALERKVRDLVLLQDLQGFLLSGGSNRRNEVRYERFLPAIARLKRDFPHLRIAAHTALLDAARARALADAGVDTAMMDVIGAAATIREVYHLDRPVADFEATLAALCTTGMAVVPHIVIGLHYGRILGEEAALDIVARHRVAALVLVVVMPFHARPGTFATPDAAAVGRFFLAARRRLACPVLLGCARPPGPTQDRGRRLCGDGGARRHRVSRRRRRGAGARPRPPGRAGACVLLGEVRRDRCRPGGGCMRVIDVLVIGLGPAGACAAAAAARAGARVVALDRRAAAGVPVQCAELVPRTARARGGAGRGRHAAGPPHAHDARGPGDRDRPVPRLDDRPGALRCAAVPRRRCRRGRVPLRHRRAQNRARRVRDLSTGEALAARVIVGADGPRSRAGTAIGAPNRALVETRQITVPLLRPHDATDIFLDAALPGRLWLAVSARACRPSRRRRGAAGKALPQADPRAAACAPGGRRAGGAHDPRDHRRRDPGRRPGRRRRGPGRPARVAAVLLAGDAAGLANPVTGAGIAAAVMSGRLAGAAAASGGFAAYREEIADTFGASLRARAAPPRGADAALSLRRAGRGGAAPRLDRLSRVLGRVMACIAPAAPSASPPASPMQPRAPTPVPDAARNGARVKADGVAPRGIYRPNDNILTPHMRSPDYVQMSTAAAITLGVVAGEMYRCGCTRCLNLLLTYPEGCRANCAYCGLARHREATRDYADRNFIRVDWPAVPLAEVVETVARQGEATPFHRMCISMITHPCSDADTRVVLKAWTDRDAHVPVSILSNPTTMTRADVVALKRARRRHLHRGARRLHARDLCAHPRQGRRQPASLGEILGDLRRTRATCSGRRRSACT